MINNNFIECKTVELANMVDLNNYTFVKYSETRDVYIFKRRATKNGE